MRNGLSLLKKGTRQVKGEDVCRLTEGREFENEAQKPKVLGASD